MQRIALVVGINHYTHGGSLFGCVDDAHAVKAVLERGKRKWEFVWRGIKISAPVSDESFYDKFFKHEITIAPGDSLKVKLNILQQLLQNFLHMINLK